ncbi:hypothetical protein Q8791_23560 [Nocardiopsis sp. CT-R113]|uniref:Uncharacterized protein n=1 Tax=Nocardiopsis codii TaxID=3065942 RepID=A0ABU7KE60_9ACTN|nr:hypothetical protein [Nocardiopsis sp. CT-R113]MEE2040199.1 hypothetical protein [Nocardiopsis sp. CT-R113]
MPSVHHSPVWAAPFGTGPDEPGWSWLGTINSPAPERTGTVDTTPPTDIATLYTQAPFRTPGMDYTPPTVERYTEGNFGGIRPRFDNNWHPLSRLRWSAAVAELDSGLRIRVYLDGGRTYLNGRQVFDGRDFHVVVGNRSRGGLTYDETNAYLDGVVRGGTGTRRPSYPHGGDQPLMARPPETYTVIGRFNVTLGRRLLPLRLGRYPIRVPLVLDPHRPGYLKPGDHRPALAQALRRMADDLDALAREEPT